MTRDVQGSNYAATQHLDIAEIAKLVRADLKTAQHDGTLPAQATIRCRIERYSLGQSLRVEIDAMPDTWTYNQPGREPDYANNIAPTAAAPPPPPPRSAPSKRSSPPTTATNPTPKPTASSSTSTAA